MRNFVFFFIILFFFPKALSGEDRRIAGLCDDSLGAKCSKLTAVLDLAAWDEKEGHLDTAAAIYRGVCLQNDQRGCREWSRIKKKDLERAPCALSLTVLSPDY